MNYNNLSLDTALSREFSKMGMTVKGLSQGSGWAIQEQSRSCCEATPSLF